MPARSSPTDIWARDAYMTAMTEGGIIVPREPPAQIVPAIRLLS